MLADRIIFVCIIVLAAGYFYATSEIPSLEIGDPLGPKAFPRLLGIALLLTAGLLFLEMMRARASRVAPEEEAPKEDKPAFDFDLSGLDFPSSSKPAAAEADKPAPAASSSPTAPAA